MTRPPREAHVRTVVADILGVDPHELVPSVSLVDDLAADSLDVAELAVQLEAELGITLPDHVMDRVRTYGDLVRAALSGRAAEPAVPDTDAIRVWTRLVSPHGELLRADALTPYVADAIADDALAAGHGARLEVTLAADATDDAVGDVRTRFGWLATHGVRVHVARETAARRTVAA
jgi:acyl carrier protein